MALLDSVLKQRMVGAVVLLALAVVFLPMLFNREQEIRHVVVDAPAMPRMPAVPQVKQEPVNVPEPQPLTDAAQPVESSPTVRAPLAPVAPSTPVTVPKTESAPARPAQPVAQAAAPEASRLDANRLPISWSVQLASLSNRDNALSLQKTLRSQGYNAYVRYAEGMSRVFVGPVIERDEANRLRDQINRQHKLKGFVVRFEPERN